MTLPPLIFLAGAAAGLLAIGIAAFQDRRNGPFSEVVTAAIIVDSLSGCATTVLWLLWEGLGPAWFVFAALVSAWAVAGGARLCSEGPAGRDRGRMPGSEGKGVGTQDKVTMSASMQGFGYAGTLGKPPSRM